MEINWSAIITGFLVTLVLGVLNGLIYAGTDASVVVLYWGTIGVLGGLTAGYIAGGTVNSGATNGAVATVLGSIIVLSVTVVTALLFEGLVASLGLLVFGSLVIGFYAIPGAVGGAAGSWLKHRRSAPEMEPSRA